MKIFILDNYDSFTFNLYQMVGEITNTTPLVFANDKITYQQFLKLNPDAVIISPGPGSPTNKNDFGISGEIIEKSKLPILGVCLGHQGLSSVFGGKVIHAPEVMHGRISKIYHTRDNLFKDIPQGYSAVRYHSLMIDPASFPKDLKKTAWTKDGIIMGVQHRTKLFFGVQFHPESIGTEHGKKLLENFISLVDKQKNI